MNINLNRIKRRIEIVSTIWTGLKEVDAAQTAADNSDAEFALAEDAAKRAADRATKAQRDRDAAIAVAASKEQKLAALNPFSGVSERS